MKIRHLRWLMVLLLTLATTLNYIDRQTLAVVKIDPGFQKSFALSEETYSNIVACFLWCYAVMQIFGGRVIDRLGTRLGYSLAILWWSLAQVLHPFARGPLSFGLFRGLLGVGEAGNFPAANKAVAEWFPPKERTVATGIFNIGSSLGSTVTPLVAGGLMMTLGWRAAFAFPALLGFAWIALWLWLYRPPEQHPSITPEELQFIRNGIAAEPLRDDRRKGVWKLVLTTQAFWALALARMLSEPAWQVINYWVPNFFNRVHGIRIGAVLLFTVCIFVAADLGSLFGGFLSPWLMRRGISVFNARRLTVTLGALLMPTTLLISGAGKYPALACFCVATFAHQCISSALLTLPADIFNQRAVATANGLSGGLGYIGGLLFVLLTGRLIPRFGYGPVLTIMGFLDLAGVIILWLMLRPPEGEPQTPAPLQQEPAAI